jgi:hypothetical protein
MRHAGGKRALVTAQEVAVMYIDQQELPVRSAISLVLHVPIEQLGKEITARVEAGDKAKTKSDDRFRSAGILLIQAKSRVTNFSAFLRDHCNGLTRSRAYELIKIASGEIDTIRTSTNERKRRYRARRAASAGATFVRSGTDAKTVSAATALAEFKRAVMLCFPMMDETALDGALGYATRIYYMLKHQRTAPDNRSFATVNILSRGCARLDTKSSLATDDPRAARPTGAGA